MNRRSFINLTGTLAVYLPIARKKMFENKYADRFMSVVGEKPVETMGLTLTHEHLFSIFGMDPEENTEYNTDELLSVVLPFLEQAKSAGCKTIVDCTAAFFGRNVQVLKTLAERSGMNIVTNTGIYGAANGRYIPAYAHMETSDELAKRWINEWKNGIGNTNVRPGFMKLGFNNGPLTSIDKKLIKAAATTHLATGLTIAAHTSNNPNGAFEQLDILRLNKVSPNAWIWTHAHDVSDHDFLFKAARLDAWISFDGYSKENHERFLEGIAAMKKEGYLERLLLSHDGDGYPQKGKMPSQLRINLLTDLLPALSKTGFTQEEIKQLTVVNPSRAFAVKIRNI